MVEDRWGADEFVFNDSPVAASASFVRDHASTDAVRGLEDPLVLMIPHLRLRPCGLAWDSFKPSNIDATCGVATRGGPLAAGFSEPLAAGSSLTAEAMERQINCCTEYLVHSLTEVATIPRHSSSASIRTARNECESLCR